MGKTIATSNASAANQGAVAEFLVFYNCKVLVQKSASNCKRVNSYHGETGTKKLKKS